MVMYSHARCEADRGDSSCHASYVDHSSATSTAVSVPQPCRGCVQLMIEVQSIAALEALVGSPLGTSEWYDVTQERISAFASATDDFERIHLDDARGREAGLGGTIAHGLYTLSLGPKFLYEIFSMSGHTLGLNYGFENVRFLHPVPVNSRLRMTANLVGARAIEGGIRFTITERFEIENVDKPACVADSVVAYFY